MKTRFNTIDIIAIIAELQKYIGMRLNQVYDVDTKTYLFKLNRQEEKITLLIESGIRIHTTEFEWPKNPAPSGFSMKLRKHLKNKRLEKLVQLGIDRVIDMQFGSDDAAYHVILELYDKGNIALTDCTYMILNILRPRTIGSEDVKLVVREKYPIENARQGTSGVNRDEIYNALNAAKPLASLKKTLMPCLPFGPAVLDHVLSQSKFPKNCSIGKQFNISSDINHLFLCLQEAEKFMTEAASGRCKGYIIQKVEKSSDALGNSIVTNVEFHPFLYAQHNSSDYTEYPSFDKAVDNFFSNLEGQKIDLKALQKEKEAMKKLENVKKDHEQRLQKLHKGQEEDVKKAQLIEMNLDFVDKAILIMRGTIAGQFSWDDIHEMVAEAKRSKDPVACAIKKLKLEINHITLMLSDPYADDYSDDENTENSKSSMAVDIDLGLSAYANARKYYDQKRHFAKKEQKTIESSEKAYKSAERKTKLALKEVAVMTSVTKARKTFWFEKFLWFISSENYLVIAGRDIQQNELIVKRYMKPGDIYVHADVHGASSVVIKNFQGSDIPPKTLNEAGTMAICYSTAWEAKIVTSAWWVYHHQVSKTAPSGEYLTTGSFMIRGKKNYLPPSHLILGFGFLFKLDEDSVERHSGERNSSDDMQADNVAVEAQDEVNDLVSDDDDDDGTSTENNDEQHLEDNNENFSDNESTCSSDKHRSSTNSSVEFPDTEVKFDMLKIDPSKDENNKSEDNVETTMIVQVPKKVKKTAKAKKNIVFEEEETVHEVSKKEKQGAPKRGQKGKLKKIKEKYKDQDEEERNLRMKILASAGERKEDKKKKKNKEAKASHKPNNKQKNVHFAKPAEQEVFVTDSAEGEGKTDLSAITTNETDSAPVIEEHNVSEDEIEGTDRDVHTSDDIKILCSLTGMPTSEDTLLFALPVCAPYMAMQNYKYKVKVMPGGGRRGKASKTALQLFLHDKSGTSREKDLLRSVKDQDISRNFPGKVKLSAPNLKKAK